jgi:hypothetical protein
MKGLEGHKDWSLYGIKIVGKQRCCVVCSENFGNSQSKKDSND